MRALLVLVVLAGASHADDRCAQIERAITATKDIDTAARVLDGTIAGIAMGERAEITKGKLISFCVVADPPLAVEPCLAPLAYKKPIVHRALIMHRELWQVADSTPRKGQPFANRMPRVGPAFVGLMLAKPQGKRLPKSPAKIPFHALDRKADVATEICFVDGKVGD